MSALHKLSYGLFVLTAKDGEKDNGCIINTAIQAASEPLQLSICVNKANYTHDMILKTNQFNISILTQEASFNIYKHFGFQSGKDVDKFENFDKAERSTNGIMYLSNDANAFLSVKVEQTVDLGSHTMFVGKVTEEKVISDIPSVTYQYYFDNVKPKPVKTDEKKKGFVCKICGYVYEGDTLPDDFVCPLCKHGAEDFEPL